MLVHAHMHLHAFMRCSMNPEFRRSDSEMWNKSCKTGTVQSGTDLDRPWGFQEVAAPRFQGSWHFEVVRLSTLGAGHLYPQEIFLVLISVRGWVESWPKGHSEAGRIMSMKNSVTPVGIEPAAFRLVVQCLDKQRHHMPHTVEKYYEY